MSDAINNISGNKMLQLRQEIAELRELLKKEEDAERIKGLKKAIMEKETHYNILADRQRLG